MGLTTVATIGVAVNNKILKHDGHPALLLVILWPVLSVPDWATVRILCFLNFVKVDSLKIERRPSDAKKFGCIPPIRFGDLDNCTGSGN